MRYELYESEFSDRKSLNFLSGLYYDDIDKSIIIDISEIYNDYRDIKSLFNGLTGLSEEVFGKVIYLSDGGEFQKGDKILSYDMVRDIKIKSLSLGYSYDNIYSVGGRNVIVCIHNERMSDYLMILKDGFNYIKNIVFSYNDDLIGSGVKFSDTLYIGGYGSDDTFRNVMRTYRDFMKGKNIFIYNLDSGDDIEFPEMNGSNIYFIPDDEDDDVIAISLNSIQAYIRGCYNCVIYVDNTIIKTDTVGYIISSESARLDYYELYIVDEDGKICDKVGKYSLNGKTVDVPSLLEF